MKFIPVFTLHVKHTYYADGRCPDFRLEPHSFTERLLKNHRCVLKSLPDGIRVFMAAGKGDRPFIPFPENMTFIFHMRLTNPNFALLTDLSEINGQPGPFFSNAHLNPGDGKKLQLDFRIARHTKQFVVTYPVLPRRERGVFADVEIRNNSTLQPAGEGPVAFEIAFTARRARWRYYLVTDLKGVEGGFRIIDKNEPDALEFSDRNRTDLVEHPDPLDDLAKELAEQYPGAQRLRFVSNGPVPCREAPRKHLELHMDGNRLSGPLPNPSFRNYSKIEWMDGAEQLQQDSLFQVVKYLTHPFSGKGV